MERYIKYLVTVGGTGKMQRTSNGLYISFDLLNLSGWWGFIGRALLLLRNPARAARRTFPFHLLLLSDGGGRCLPFTLYRLRRTREKKEKNVTSGFG